MNLKTLTNLPFQRWLNKNQIPGNYLSSDEILAELHGLGLPYTEEDLKAFLAPEKQYKRLVGKTMRFYPNRHRNYFLRHAMQKYCPQDTYCFGKRKKYKCTINGVNYFLVWDSGRCRIWKDEGLIGGVIREWPVKRNLWAGLKELVRHLELDIKESFKVEIDDMVALSFHDESRQIMWRRIGENGALGAINEVSCDFLLPNNQKSGHYEHLILKACMIIDKEIIGGGNE